MKVYELMNEWADVPAGAEVRFGHVITTVDFNKMELINETVGNEIRRFTVDMEGFDIDTDHIDLYGTMRG